jgi:NADH:ubiquinone oxidoreductase subunit C
MLVKPISSNTIKEGFVRKYFDFIKNMFIFFKDCAMYDFDFSIRSVKNNLLIVLVFLKYDFLHQFTVCIDIIAYDQPGKIYRFTVVYYILSLNYNSRYKVIVQTSAYLGIETISGLYKSAN